ncbi:peptide/nickel transport system substrate-binding protein [Cytobacillus firmus]|uniref:Peptide/nickel transport system substrate-binding protein n=2 Tax=Cytobacillus TaxID=2675230 RepID=A0A366JHG7_CYTFI|nr:MULTISPECIES: ABC transporter substrate-binding protein [Cytobacillus]RBP85899.1 peptide/nickel transport system substrate-binding protein [Cytobacillus firmus]TDX35103.1 peptide/nickel transport system substrate-binding protein [Cytobacillus oceanisediminis]
MKSKKSKILSLFLLSFVLLFSGCNYGGDSSSTTSSGEGSEETTTGPRKGGKVTIPIVADPTFNPWHPNAYAESNVINRVIFSGLTQPGKDLLPAPDLAKEWSTSEDGLEWTFILRDDVKWHDGEKFTAEDVAFTFNEVALNKKLGANNSSYFQKLKEVQVVDDYTVKFILASPVAALPAYLSFNTEIIPKHIFEGQDPWELTSFNKQKPVGTGSFKIKSYTSGQTVVLERNDDYYGEKVYLDEVEYKVLADANTHVAQVLSGELSIFALDDLAAIDRIKNAEGVEVVARDTTRFFWIILNQQMEQFQDVKVRQAVLHAIDRQNIIDTVLKGYGTIADTGIAPALKEYYTDDVKRYEYDPEQAKKLLSEAGLKDTNGDGLLEKDGKTFTIDFKIGIQGDIEAVSQMVQQYLKAVGLDVKLNTMEWNAMIQDVVVKRNYEMSLNWWRYPSDPDLSAYMHSANVKGNNIPAYQNAELDKLLDAGAQESDVGKRKEIYVEAQKMMAEQLPYIFLWYPQEAQVRVKKLKGVPDLAFGDALHYINEWYIEE